MQIKIASRQSVLAMWQTNHIKARLEAAGHSVQIITMKTKGDIILDTPLAKIGGKGLFTKELENAMLSGEADIAVHSLKDVPTTFPAGLRLAAVCSREDVRDAILSEKYADFASLPSNAKVGTTSLRRQMQILKMRPDLELISLRGNVQSRIKKLKSGEFDAIILAMAGINRLNLDAEVAHCSPLDTVPAMGQGALGIEAVERAEILEAIAFLNDQPAVIETTIERDFVHTLNGGCQAPIGVSARLDGERVRVRAVLGLCDGSEVLEDAGEFDASEFKKIGREFADKFIARGAKELLNRAEAMANEKS